ncbi:hypothetical protein D3C83_53650 [compost metagenome]
MSSILPSSATMSERKRRASVKLAIVTLPSSKATAAVYWKLNLPSWPFAVCGRSQYFITGVRIATRPIFAGSMIFAWSASAAVIAQCVANCEGKSLIARPGSTTRNGLP